MVSKLALAVLSLATFPAHTTSDPVFTPVLPPSYPLAVRNPFLSAWLPGNQAAHLPTANAQFWTGETLNWSVIARVNGTAYSLFGVPEGSAGGSVQPASVLSGDYTSTTSTFNLAAGDANFSLEFFSPVSPQNLTRQSMPFSYLTVTASSSQNSDIQIYSDIDDSWAGGLGQSAPSRHSLANVVGSQLYQIGYDDQAIYTENAEFATWGQAVYAASAQSAGSRSVASGGMMAVRSQFAGGGAANLTQDEPSSTGGVTAFVQDLGTVNQATRAMFAVGHVRDQAVNYLGSPWTHYYRALMPNTTDVVQAFFDDYEAAKAEAVKVDTFVVDQATAAAGDSYAHILSLSVRQAFGALDVTIDRSTMDTKDPVLFLKEISSDGNVNTIDVLYPTFPIYYVFYPEGIRMMMEPLMRYLATGRWKPAFAIHDLGSNYPNATGHDDGQEEDQPLEECGDILIVAYAYQKASGNTQWVKQYASIFKGYADYLVENGLTPTDQLSTDDGAGSSANQTNLAIKSAVALNAYGAMMNSKNYSDIGISFAQKLYGSALGTDPDKTHFTRNIGDSDSWTMAYNLYPDILLGLNTFPTAAVQMQSDWYASVHSPAGVALDSSVKWGKSDWMIMSAATSSQSTRDMVINDIHTFMTNGMNDSPFCDRYFVADGNVSDNGNAPQRAGDSYSYRARPVVGGHFGILAMKGANLAQGTISREEKLDPATVLADPTVDTSGGFIESKARCRRSAG